MRLRFAQNIHEALPCLNQHSKTAAITAPNPTAANEPPKLGAAPVNVAGVLVTAKPPLVDPATLLVLVSTVATPLIVVV